jgi:hypothetical protein
MLGSNVIIYVNGDVENEVIPFVLKHEDASAFTYAFFSMISRLIINIQSKVLIWRLDKHSIVKVI